MLECGLCTIYSLSNTAEKGAKPTYNLVEKCKAYYNELTVGVTRNYSAMMANQQIDKLIKCFNTDIDDESEYCILEDGKQYRITLKQTQDDGITLTLVRLGENCDVSE